MDKLQKREERAIKREQEWQIEKRILEIESKIKAEQKPFKRKLTASKLLIAFLFLNCTIVEIFVGIITVASIKVALVTGMSPDFSPLLAIVGAVVSEVIGYSVYSLKSAKENSLNGITYLNAQHEHEMEMLSFNNDDIDEENGLG